MSNNGLWCNVWPHEPSNWWWFWRRESKDLVVQSRTAAIWAAGLTPYEVIATAQYVTRAAAGISTGPSQSQATVGPVVHWLTQAFRACPHGYGQGAFRQPKPPGPSLQKLYGQDQVRFSGTKCPLGSHNGRPRAFKGFCLNAAAWTSSYTAEGPFSEGIKPDRVGGGTKQHHLDTRNDPDPLTATPLRMFRGKTKKDVQDNWDYPAIQNTAAVVAEGWTRT